MTKFINNNKLVLTRHLYKKYKFSIKKDSIEFLKKAQEYSKYMSSLKS